MALLLNQEISQIQKFNVHNEARGLAQSWKKWKRSFELYVVGTGIEDEKRQKALLLHSAGLAVQDIYFSLVGEQDKNSYKEAIAILDDHFIPKCNIPFERHMFRQIFQSDTETVDQFVCRLRERASSCDFNETADAQIRDQVIEKCNSHSLRRKFLEQDALTLDKMLQIARAHEAVTAQAKIMDYRPTTSSQVNVLNRKFDKRSPKPNQPPRRDDGFRLRAECYACGRKGHLKNDPLCPARNKLCNKCGKIGHFQVKCRTKLDPPDSRARKSGSKPNTINEVKSTEEESGYAFTLQPQTDNCIVSLNIGGVDVSNIMIDSGASDNVVDKATWEWLKQCQITATTRKSAKTLFAYGCDKPLPTLGTFTADFYCKATDKKCISEVIVIDCEGRSLLCKNTAEKLGLLHVGPPVDTENSLHADTICDGLNAVDSDIFRKYDNLFSGVGLLKGVSLKLHIDESVKPVAQHVRRVPFQLRGRVDQKIDELLEANIIEEVPEGPSGWISPLVVIPKNDGDVRICVDMRRANEAIIRERHPIPTVEELLHQLNGSTMFSKLDLKWGFHQIPLDEESRHVTTFVTHRGLFRYKRLMFGLSSAPEKYQKIICDVLKRCQGVANIADDVIVYGRNQEEHDRRLFAVLDKLKESGMTLNKRKCEFRMPELTFFGLNLTEDGINPTEEKIAAILNAGSPKTASEARSFMGLVQYSARFIPNLSTISKPIRDLTIKNQNFTWGREQEKAFLRLKTLISSAETLAYFRRDCQTRIIADASPVGLGAVLTQLQDGQWRVVSYASRSLTDVERRYSQTEREALALVWACERFNLYVFGKEFELETDHKPLQFIYSKTSRPSARVERWVLRLQAYDYKVVYRPGKSNIADSLSRLRIRTLTKEGRDHDYLRMIVTNYAPIALTPRELEQASGTDEEFETVRNWIKTGDWSKCRNPSYLHVKEELCCYGRLILRGTRIVIPNSLREQVLNLAHEGHQGVVKTKNRLRTKVWWPKMDKDAEKLCKNCHGCQVVGEYNNPEPMNRVLPPSGPWQSCAADLLGPLPSGDYILVVVDYYSRYFEVAILKTITSTKVIEAMIPMFSRYGNPFSLRTDNGRQFISTEFEEFLQENGITHQTSTPLWPQANGEVERQNRTLMKAIRIAQVEHKDWKSEINRFLMAYRSTPQSTTGRTPFYLMFGREMRSKLPELCREQQEEEVQEHDWRKKIEGKWYTDKRRNAVDSKLQAGDEVLIRCDKTNKLSPNFDPLPGKVVGIGNNGEITVEDGNGVQFKRNSTFVKKYNSPNDPIGTDIQSDCVSQSDDCNNAGNSNTGPVLRTRPTRNIVPPAKLKDYSWGYGKVKA